jgi:hypothetical protein
MDTITIRATVALPPRTYVCQGIRAASVVVVIEMPGMTLPLNLIAWGNNANAIATLAIGQSLTASLSSVHTKVRVSDPPDVLERLDAVVFNIRPGTQGAEPADFDHDDDMLVVINTEEIVDSLQADTAFAAALPTAK